MTALAAATATLAPPRYRCTLTRAVASAVPGSATSSTMPSASASWASTMRPEKTRSFVRGAPISRASRWVPPPPGTSPRVTSGRPTFAPASTTRKSQARASSKPPPRA